MNTSSAINGTIDAMTDFANPPIGWQHKAFGTDLEGRDGSDLEPLGISALDGNLLLPVMTLNRAAIAHNVDSWHSSAPTTMWIWRLTRRPR